MTATIATHKSRFGYHACDYATYQKVRKLNSLYCEAQKKFAAWQRWNNKEPQNRVIRKKIRDSKGHVVGYQAPVPMPEPPMDSTFLHKRERKVYRHGGWQHKHGVAVTYYELLDYGNLIREDYRRTKPVPTPEEIVPLKMNEETINIMYERDGVSQA